MSGNDPFDPFGENERTIIRPNPGGRSPQQPQQPQQPSGGYAPPPPQGGGYAQPTGGAPSWGVQGGHGGGMVQGGAPQAVGGAAQHIPTPSDNPLIAAAGPLLDLMGRLRNAMTQASFTDLKGSVSRELDAFDSSATDAGADPAQIRPAKYALAATADDIVQNLPGNDRHIWTQDPMLGRYFGERIGGTRFYENLGAAVQNPGANYHLLELMYVCLSQGFEGMHRASAAGASAVQAARRDVYQALRSVKPGGAWAISPNWKGMDLARRSIGMQIPFWAVAALAGLLLTGAFFGLRWTLGQESQELTTEIAQVHPEIEVEIARAVAVAPPPPPPPPVDNGQLDRIRAALAPEIAQGLVTAEYLDANFIIVKFSNKLLFPSGKAEVSDAFRAELASRIGETFKRETELLAAKGLRHGRVAAIGHSDAQPLSSTSRWGSNHELSKARAQSVVDAVLSHSPPDLRTLVEGRGPDDPICTPAEQRNCWPENRRVEFLIERTL